MSTFDELDQYLTPDYQIDYWSDYAIDHATELIDQLNQDDWTRLEKTWMTKEPGWQVRLADGAFGSDKSRVVALLSDMLKSSDLRVALAALESLEARDDATTLDASLHPCLERLLEQTEGTYRQMIEGLISRIQK
ncbi:MAG: hypothetical protein WBV94_15255 [Blastocatellia bacterium]